MIHVAVPTGSLRNETRTFWAHLGCAGELRCSCSFSGENHLSEVYARGQPRLWEGVTCDLCWCSKGYRRYYSVIFADRRYLYMTRVFLKTQYIPDSAPRLQQIPPALHSSVVLLVCSTRFSWTPLAQHCNFQLGFLCRLTRRCFAYRGAWC